jgi:hypothetical protein
MEVAVDLELEPENLVEVWPVIFSDRKLELTRYMYRSRRQQGGRFTTMPVPRHGRQPPYIGDWQDMQHGGSWSDFTNWVRGAANTVYQKALVPTAHFIKDQHILSTAAGLLLHPAAKFGAIGLRQAGFGKKKRTGRYRVIHT